MLWFWVSLIFLPMIGVVVADQEAEEEEVKPDEVVVADNDKLLLKAGFTADEIADLSDEEKEGLLSDREKVNNPEAEETVVAKPVDDLSKEQLAEIVGEEKPAEAVPVAEKPAGEEQPTVIVVTDEELLSYRPVIDETKLPQAPEEKISSEMQNKLDEIDKKYEDIEKRFDDGDITKAEASKERREADKERDSINRQIMRENVGEYEIKKSAAKFNLTWAAEQVTFFKARAEYKIGEGSTPKSRALFGALNSMVKEITADPANNGLSGIAVLVKADKLVRESFGLPTPGKAKKAEEVVDKKPPAEIPDEKTLADLPASMPNDTGNWMTALDKLSGEPLEKALAALTPSQRERYRTGAK